MCVCVCVCGGGGGGGGGGWGGGRGGGVECMYVCVCVCVGGGGGSYLPYLPMVPHLVLTIKLCFIGHFDSIYRIIHAGHDSLLSVAYLLRARRYKNSEAGVA